MRVKGPHRVHPTTEPKSPGPRASVVIPTRDGAHHLPDCLGSLERQTFRDFETILVDNGSADGSGDLVRRRFPWAQWVPLGRNRGFSAAVNEGIRRSKGLYVVLLNNDTRADARWLEGLVAAMDRTPEAAFGACKLVSFDRPPTIDAAGDGYSLIRASAFRIGEGMPASAFSTTSWVFGASAAAAIYRRSLLEDIGLFDEDFFFLFEDVDLDLRAQVAGHRCLYVPGAVVSHKRGASADIWTPDVQARALRNRIWVAGKNLPGPLFALWWACFIPRIAWILVHVAILGRHPAPRGIRPTSLPRGWSLARYLGELVTALRRTPAKRRAARPLRRLRSLELLTRLTMKHRPVGGA